MKVYQNNDRKTATIFSAPKEDLFASIVVFLVALPLCMGIAIASGVPVAAGLVTGIIGGLVVGYFSGAPLQVSGPAAGLTIIVYEFVQSYGWETLGLAVLVGGILQLVAGVLHLGQWFRAVSPAVIQGMLAGIGVLILSSQFHVMVDDSPKENGLANLMTIPQAVEKGIPWPEWRSRSEYQARVRLLKRFGTLHEEQVQIQALFSEVIKGAQFERSKNESRFDLLSRQKNVVRQVELLVDDLNQNPIFTSDSDSMGILRTTANQARKQVQTTMYCLQKGQSDKALQSLADAQDALENLLNSLKDHSWAAKVGLLTIVILFLWKVVAPQRLQLIPAPLVAITAATALAAFLHLPVLYVEVPDNLWSEVRFPTLTSWYNIPFLELIKMGVVIAVVASAETLLCATAVDQIQQRWRTDYDRELTAQGIGNIICGLLGALPMTGVIARSSANVEAGAQTRLSAIVHGVWLLIFVSTLAFLLRMIPTAALAAMLVYTGYKLINPQAVSRLWKYGWGEVVVYAITLVTIVGTDLLTGVIVGFVVSAARLLYRFSQLQTTFDIDKKEGKTVLKINGAATFLRLPQLAKELERVPVDANLHIDFERLDYIDHACLELLLNWAKQHESQGGSLVIDWDALHATFHSESRLKYPVPRNKVA
ncbi:MAG: hypothetical protein CME31_26810 [Gimesia sp.]|nr:hypothetical protein [Gimesia sp.]|tara:strand:+ start:8704 stop:10656 length:1953 start_codon:yes stop_codon:yes gene_type:complete